MLLIAAKDALLALNRSEAWYAICGGLAVGIHGHVRATRNVAIWFASQADAELGIAVLQDQGWQPSGDALPLPDGVVIRRLHLLAEPHLVTLDCLIPPDHGEWRLERELADLDHCRCWVLDRSSLLRLKRWSDRPQDRADIAALEDVGDD